MQRFLPFVILCGALMASSTLTPALRADERSDHFEKYIRPVLVAKCIQCHGVDKQESGLRLDSLNALLEGGDSGPVLDEDDLPASLLLEAIEFQSFEMPPSGQLPEATRAHFRTWLEKGAYWPENATLQPAAEREISDDDRQWWAFQPVREITLPETDETRNPIDLLVARQHKELGLSMAPKAKREVLLRRAYYDLLGVPPSSAEVRRFLNDASPNAFESLVDRLLEDQRYGEHWARYWLDLVRYSESDGWNQDAYRPAIYRYRDYVVQSLNADKPYSEFVLEQLAGDELPGDEPEHITATGFLRLGIYEYNQRDARGHWNDIMNEITDVVGDVFLGVSMACARCHDHKFDPVPQRDYFQLRAHFEPIEWRDDLVAATEAQIARYQAELDEWKANTAQIQAEIDAVIEPYYKKKWESTVDKFPLDIQACFHMPVQERTSWQNQMAYLVARQFMEEGGGPLKSMSKEDKQKLEELEKQLATFDDAKPEPLPTIMAATDFDGIASSTFVQDDASRTAVAPAHLSVLSPRSQTGDAMAPSRTDRIETRFGSSTGRRTQLAQWIADAQNPLTTRVIVNRIWQKHFGTGIVETSSDFGTQGQLPSNPALLDWLTRDFVDNGWSFKRLHKLILMSDSWQQSAHNPQALEYQKIDPAEKHLWRAPVRRLDAEQIRDAMLVASGEIDWTVGGPSVEEKDSRRSLYIKSFRNKNDGFLNGFDMANGLKSVPIRNRTTTPTQALLLINGQYALARANAMAEQLLNDMTDPSEIINDSFIRAWGRTPTAHEFTAAEEFLGVVHGEERAHIEASKLSDFCHVLFNANQFLYLE